MNTCPLLIPLCTVILALDALAQVAAPAPVTVNPSVRLTGRTFTGGRSVATTWSTTWGSFNKVAVSKRIIAITMSTLARQPQEAEVEVIFIWRDQESKAMTYTTTGKQKLTATSGRPATCAGEDAQEDSHDRYAALGEEQKTGLRYFGWVARATDTTGAIVAVCASTPAFEKYAGAGIDDPQ